MAVHAFLREKETDVPSFLRSLCSNAVPRSRGSIEAASSGAEVCATHKVRPKHRTDVATSASMVEQQLAKGAAMHCGGVHQEEEPVHPAPRSFRFFRRLGEGCRVGGFGGDVSLREAGVEAPSRVLGFC